MAGLYTDDLSRCLVSSTTENDRVTLVKWIFAAMAQHPAVSSLATVSTADLEKSNQDTANLFMKLLTETCAAKTKDAVKYEGGGAVGNAFQVLGQVAATDIFSDPKVTEVISGLEKYIDKKKLEELNAK